MPRLLHLPHAHLPATHTHMRDIHPSKRKEKRQGGEEEETEKEEGAEEKEGEGNVREENERGAMHACGLALPCLPCLGTMLSHSKTFHYSMAGVFFSSGAVIPTGICAGKTDICLSSLPLISHLSALSLSLTLYLISLFSPHSMSVHLSLI